MRLSDALSAGLDARIYSDKDGDYVAIGGDSWVRYVSGNELSSRTIADIDRFVDSKINRRLKRNRISREPEETGSELRGSLNLVVPQVRDITHERGRRL